MQLYSEYYRQRLYAQKIRLEVLNDNTKAQIENITGKKRKYEEAMGYTNDYPVVQEPASFTTPNKGLNWIDSYSENLCSQKTA